MVQLTKLLIEDAALSWLLDLGWQVLHGPEIVFDGPTAERAGPKHQDVILETRLCEALKSVNPALPVPSVEDVLRKFLRTQALSLMARNRLMRKIVVDGVDLEATAKTAPLRASRQE